ncbi:hypothetical protein [uncultured Methanomethylovorans sp.]|uniref:hypothetical protein n=1 Tax=uncultured Methanomethylovorans sp. TaxID=183759 RepID=UPI002AA85E7B|nr:hypothetical protein [uncultured Methanomethylovorans sp.]
MIKKIFCILFVISFMILNASASENFVTDVTYDLSEGPFLNTAVTNPESKNVRQIVMGEKGVDSLENFPISTTGCYRNVTSPNGEYLATKFEMYKSGNILYEIHAAGMLPFRVAFSPDSSMFVIPKEKNVVDNNCTGRKLIGFEVRSSETGKRINEFFFDLYTEGIYPQEMYKNNLVQLYWSADGSAIIADYVHKEYAVEYDPAAELSYIKCDIDYSALSHNETMSNETVYSGPSSVEIEDINSNINSSQTSEPSAQEASSAPGFSVILAGLSIIIVARKHFQK